jgi:hypothetical protein
MQKQYLCLAFSGFHHRRDNETVTLLNVALNTNNPRGHCGRDRMVVGFTTVCAISAYHH